jgi:hypothetical protein
MIRFAESFGNLYHLKRRRGAGEPVVTLKPSRKGGVRMSLRTAALIVAAAGIFATPAGAAQDPELYGIARDAYVYAFPIVTMDVTMRQMTNVPDAQTVPLRAPVNQLAHARTYPAPDDHSVVRFNFDTLYSIAWLDLSREPVVLSVPNMGDRYYLFQLLDMWTDTFAVPGTRTSGSGAGRFAIVAPGWTGTLPAGVTRIDAPTSTVWLIGRTQTNGPGDFANVHAVQDQYSLTPLGQLGGSYTPPAAVPVDPSIDAKTEPVKQVAALSGVAMLERLASLMTRYPPHAIDTPILWRMKRLGIEAGKPFDATKLPPGLAATIDAAAKDARASIVDASRAGFGAKVHGWSTSTDGIGAYGSAYRRRAAIAYAGLGANLPEDAVYPSSVTDVAGEPYLGENRYRIRFEKEALPPVDAFWSITLYDEAGFQVPNALNRFALGDRDPLQYGDDGSLEIYIEHESPGADQESNWLPCPEGRFTLAMRLYSPRYEVLDGKWEAPGVVKMTRGHPKRNR